MRNCLVLAFIFSNLPHHSIGITTIHHDKPERSSISIMSEKYKLNNITLTNSERHKRLLPYVNFYQAQNFNRDNNRQSYEKYQQPKKVYVNYDYRQNPDINYQSNVRSPFTKNNAIPGPFKPIPQSVKVEYVPITQNKVPNFSELYDKLTQLKLAQNYRGPTYVQINRPVQQESYILKPQVYNRHKLSQPSKTTIETYTATNIDIPSEPEANQYQIYENKPYINQQIAIDIPHSSLPEQIYNTKPYTEVKKPFIIVPANPQDEPNQPYIVVPRKQTLFKKPSNYEIPKYVQITPQYQNNYQTKYEQYPKYEVPPKYEETPKYEEVPKYESTPSPADHQTHHSKNVVNLATFLPKTLTTNNVDNSIRTLIKILNTLKNQRKPSKPIIVQEEGSYVDDIQNEAGVGNSGHPNELPGASNEAYPEDTDEGGTPGKPGVDYPALSTIPQTSFNCKTQRYKGFFGDPDTHCQVWHYCDLNGGQASFLCPNGTIFSQVALTCDWWYNVKCSSTAQLYVLNERLYKYIIPLSPKFPEDYTGPLVDKYLALKFQEMEEKLRKEKQGNDNSDKEEESTESEDIEAEKTSKVETTTKAIRTQHKETLDTVEDDNEH